MVFLEDEGFDAAVLEALHSVTKMPEEEATLKSLFGEERVTAYLQFVARAKNNAIGRRVKRADIFDNLNVTNQELTGKDMARLNPYKRAIEFLDQ